LIAFGCGHDSARATKPLLGYLTYFKNETAIASALPSTTLGDLVRAKGVNWWGNIVMTQKITFDGIKGKFGWTDRYVVVYLNGTIDSSVERKARSRIVVAFKVATDVDSRPNVAAAVRTVCNLKVTANRHGSIQNDRITMTSSDGSADRGGAWWSNYKSCVAFDSHSGLNG
jgi:hypothetical protein